jgi:hypothetical protein
MNEESDSGKGMQIVAVMIMVMAALTGAVSQEITKIQDEASQEEMEYQDLFAGARALEATENQVLLRDVILLTEANSQDSQISALSTEKNLIENQISSMEEDYWTSILRAEIDTYYLQGSDLLWMDWSQGLLIQTCYSSSSWASTATGVHPQCRAEVVDFIGTDEVSTAVQLSFTWDEQQGVDSLSQMVSFLPLIAEDYDGFYEPYMSSCNYWTNCIQIQFPLFSTGGWGDTYDTGWGAIMQNWGFSSHLWTLEQEIEDTNYFIEFYQEHQREQVNNMTYYWNEYSRSRDDWLHFIQLDALYYALDDIETSNYYWDAANNTQLWMNHWEGLYENTLWVNNWTIYMIEENMSTLKSQEENLKDRTDSYTEKEGKRQTSISESKSMIKEREESLSRLDQIDSEMAISIEMKSSLISETVAFQMGFISSNETSIPDRDSKSEFESIVHEESREKYDQAGETKQDALVIREGLESITMSIMFISGGNVLFGASGGMLREKRLGYKGGSARSALLVFAGGCLSSIAGLFLYLF